MSGFLEGSTHDRAPGYSARPGPNSVRRTAMRMSNSSALLAVPFLLFAVGCSAAKDESKPAATFQIRNTPDGVAPSTPLLIDGPWLAYLASESASGNTDMNGDGDMSDAIAVRINTGSQGRTMLGVATRSMVYLNATLFLVVSEADDKKIWNGDGDMNDLVLLYVESAATTPTFFATLDPAAATVVAVDDRLVYVDPAAPVAEFATNLMSTTVSTPGAIPDMPVPVTSTIDDAADDGVSLSIWRVDDGMLFLTMDETVDGDLNGDGNPNDTTVLALYDGGDVAAQVTSVGKAVDPLSNVTVLRDGTDWTVAFLVNEQGEEANLNDPLLFDPTWQPFNCAFAADADMDDDVLHWLLYSDFLATPANVRNTGLVGRALQSDKLYLMESAGRVFAGVVSLESDEGSGAGCDLNGDSTWNDLIFRWVEASDPLATPLPEAGEDKMLALATTIPGFYGPSSGGVIPMDAVWVVLVDEAADGHNHDGDAGTDNLLLAAIVPSNPVGNWNFNHGTSNPGPVSVTWMADNLTESNSFVAALDEDVLGSDLNFDGDEIDSVPTFPELSSANILKFPGYGVAVKEDDAGVTTARGLGFFRVSEKHNNLGGGVGIDLNGDGDDNDYVLYRIARAPNASPIYMGTLNSLPIPSITFETEGVPLVGAFLYDEAAAKVDLNKDGLANDLVVRYFRFP